MTHEPRAPHGASTDRDAAPGGLPGTGVLFFSTPGCVACRTVRARIADLTGRDGAPVVEVAGDADAAARFRVFAAPTLIALHDGVEVARHAGTASEEVIDRLRAAAMAGTTLQGSTVPAGLTALRMAVAVVLLVVGVVTSTAALVVIGALVAAWAVVPVLRKAHELRTR